MTGMISPIVARDFKFGENRLICSGTTQLALLKSGVSLTHDELLERLNRKKLDLDVVAGLFLELHHRMIK